MSPVNGQHFDLSVYSPVVSALFRTLYRERTVVPVLIKRIKRQKIMGSTLGSRTTELSDTKCKVQVAWGE